MAKNIWTVDPGNTTRVDLEWNGNKFWVTLKNELSIGEQRYSQTAGFKNVTGSQAPSGPMASQQQDKAVEIGVDWKLQSFARTYAYVVDWSLTDDESTKLKLVPDVIQALHVDLYEVIEGAINTHVGVQEAKKKSAAGGSSPIPTSS